MSNYKLIDDIITLMLDVGFLDKKGTDLTKLYESMAASYERPDLHRFHIISQYDKLKAHSAAFQIGERDKLIHHMVARWGSVSENLEKLSKWLVSNYFDSTDWVHAFYRPGNSWPSKVLGGIVKAVAEDYGQNDICIEKSYGYKEQPGLAIPSFEEMDELVQERYYLPLYLEPIHDTHYQNKFFSKRVYNAYLRQGPYIGTLTVHSSSPWLNASNLLNCHIFDLVRSVDFRDIAPDPSKTFPILWNPVEFVIDEKPDKIYNHWKIRMDKRSFPYFGIEGENYVD